MRPTVRYFCQSGGYRRTQRILGASDPPCRLTGATGFGRKEGTRRKHVGRNISFDKTLIYLVSDAPDESDAEPASSQCTF